MPDSSLPATPETAACPVHGQPAKWQCPVCGQLLCPACQPVAWNYQVFHHACLAANRDAMEKRGRAPMPADAPTPGVRAAGYYLIVKAMIFLAFFLLLTGIAIFARSLPLRAVMATPLPAGLDAIPGGRGMVAWAGIFCLGLSGLWLFLGIGLLNCSRLARTLVLWIAAVDILLGVLVWLVILVSGEGLWTVPAISLVFLIYFMRKDVKRQFT